MESEIIEDSVISLISLELNFLLLGLYFKRNWQICILSFSTSLVPEKYIEESSTCLTHKY